MSADNWKVCPKCLARNLAELRELQKAVDAAYGKVPKEEYMKLRVDVDNFAHLKEENFREDYEIYTDDKLQLTVSYYGQCTVCEETKTFKYDESKGEKA
jgi:hypothetical protein